MKILFVHQNYPGQYREIIPRLCASGRHEVVFLTQREKYPDPQGHVVLRYKPDPLPEDKHPYTSWYQRCIANAIGLARACRALDKKGFKPDIVVGHAGWGELIFVKQVWPDIPVIGYFEYYFIANGGLIGFDPEFREAPDVAARVHARNAPNYLSLMSVDDGYSASTWQKHTYPEIFHPKIRVFHEGIRTDRLNPDHDGAEPVTINDTTFARSDEIVTYIARNLEPSRGFHIMMRALPALQKARPNAHVAIIGGDGISYGGRLPGGQTFRGRLSEEMKDKVDWNRVHFLGQIPYDQLTRLLQLSNCHVYLTAPFVVSWSLLESMALEKTIVASNVEPVRNYIENGKTGFLVDFFSPEGLAARIADVLAHPDNYREVGRAARRNVVANYDFHTVCYPAFIEMLNANLTGAKRIEV